MKKMIRAAVAAAALCVCLIIWLWAGREETFSLPEGEGTWFGMTILSPEDYAVLEGRCEALAHSGGEVLCRGIPAPADTGTGRIYVPVMDLETGGRTDPAEPILSAGREGERLFISRDALPEDLAGAVREGNPLKVLLSSDKACRGLDLVLTGLPILALTKEDQDPVRGKEDHAGTMTLLSGDSGESWASPCLFHMRGNTSTFYDKKSFKISLKNEKGAQKKLDLLGIRKDDDWILNPLLTDRSRVREKTAYDLWNRMQKILGLEDPSSAIRYVEVFLNGEPAGLYGLMVPVDKKLLSLRKGDRLYKINTWEVPSPEEYRAYADREEVLKPNGIAYMDCKYPDPGSPFFGWDTMEAFQTYVYGNMTEKDLAAEGIVIDRTSLSAYTVFCMLVHAMDNTWKNTYVIARRGEDGTCTLSRTVWDLNYTFGDVFAGKVENFYTAFRPETARELVPFRDTPFDYQKWASEDIEAAFEACRAVWSGIRKGGISDVSIWEQMEKNAAILEGSGALEREKVLWEEPGAEGPAAREKEWIRERVEYLDGIFAYPGP